MKYLLFLPALLLPCSTAAAPFFIETTYATGEPGITGSRDDGIVGSGNRNSSRSPVVSSAPPLPVIEFDPTTFEVPISPSSSSTSSAPSVPSVSSASSASFVSFASSASFSPPSTEELDRLTLEEFEAYANEAAQNLEEQMKELAQGFSVTGTSTLGSPLPANQRSAILRSKVRTVGQLKLFAKALVESDEDIRKITVNDHSASITVRNTARLFWFIPIGYLSTTTAQFDGTVAVDTPWWLLLSSHTENTPEVDPIEGDDEGRVQRIAELLQSLLAMQLQ